MKCENCKEKPATIHLTEIVNGHRNEKHLCQRCAEQEGVTVKSQISLNELLTSLLAAQEPKSEENLEELAQLKCPNCGITLEQFRRQAVLGCPHDYEVFSQILEPVIAKAHGGNSTHRGKVPAHVGQTVKNQSELLELKQQLSEAVTTEDYETAARLRDKIKQLQ